MSYEHIAVNGINLYYGSNGNENLPVALFIHGLGNSLNIWYDILDSDLSKKVRIVAIDLPGFGLSDKPRNFSYYMESQANAVLKFINKKNLDVHFLIGFSMGGTIAVYLAPFLPNLKKLIVIEPVLVNSDMGIGTIVAKTPTIIVSLVKFITRLFPRIVFSPYLKNKTKDNIRLLREGFLQTSSYAFKMSFKGMIEVALNDQAFENLKKLNVERYYFISDSLETNPKFRHPPDLFKIAKKIVIPNAKHCMMLDNFPKFYEALDAIIC